MSGGGESDALAEQDKQVKRFVNEYLKQDGVFVLRMVSMHAGILFGTELVAHLFRIFQGVQEELPQPKVENHYESNTADYLRNRKKNKELEPDFDDLATGPFLSERRSRKSSRSSSSSNSDAKRKSLPDDDEDEKRNRV